MDEKMDWRTERKAWFEKYHKDDIAIDGFMLRYCLPEHVSMAYWQGTIRYLGFDGTYKTYDQLTPEEIKDYNEQMDKIPENISRLLSTKRTQNNQKEEAKDDDIER